MASRTYELDASRIIVSGYSMVRLHDLSSGQYELMVAWQGAFGAFAVAFASPSTFAALIPSASGSGSSDTQLASLLSTTPPISVYVLAGAQDEKQPVAGISATVDQLRALPGAAAANISIEIFQGDHHFMTSEPFEDMALWSWIGDQRKGPSAILDANATTTTSAVAGTTTSAAASSTTPTQSLTSTPLQVASSKSSGTGSGSGAAAASTTATSAAGRSLRILWW